MPGKIRVDNMTTPVWLTVAGRTIPALSGYSVTTGVWVVTDTFLGLVPAEDVAPRKELS